MDTSIPSTTIEALYSDLYTPLFRYFFFRTNDKDCARDLTQSTFLKFLKQKDRPSSRDHSLKLLFTIARTILIDHYRTEGKRRHDDIDEIEMPDNDPNPAQVFEKNEDVIVIQRAIQELSTIEQDIVTIRMTTDMDYGVIAETLSITSQNARQIHSRALKKIKVYLKDKGYNETTI